MDDQHRQMEQEARQRTESGENAPQVQEEQTEETAGMQERFDQMIQGEYREMFEKRAGELAEQRLRELRQENHRLRSRGLRQKQEAAEHLLHLRDSEQRLREKYPGFCWQREMTNPAFGRLVLAGVEPETAYAAVHRQELMQEAMRYAAGRTRRQVASSLASGARARENGGRSAAVSRSDPRGLDSRELADIRRRVMEGERISF